jgi:glycosyltransferase involved in cell wall biosynthesis
MLVVLLPGPLDARTGGSEYDRRVVASLRAGGPWTAVEIHALDPGFPFPTPHAREDAARTLAALPDRTPVVIDGLALGVLPREVAREAGRLRIVGLVHHPLALETGLDPATAAALEASERDALAAVRHVVVTSRRTAAALQAYGVTSDRITVAEPGTDRAPIARGSGGSVVQMLAVASLTPRKGHALLVEALAKVGRRDWRLTCVGSLDRDPATTARLRAVLRASGLEAQVDLAGEGDAAAVAAWYDRSDLFVLPTLYEGYGMAVAEAVARGLPVVSTTTGAIPDIVGADAGLLTAPGDREALGRALAAVIADADLRARLAEGARRARLRLPTWDAAAATIGTVLERVTRE